MITLTPDLILFLCLIALATALAAAGAWAVRRHDDDT